MPMTDDNEACELLDADHIAVKHLFVEYARQAALPAPPKGDARKALAMKICSDLTVHAQIEEEIFYPALQAAVPELAAALEEARGEHQEAKELVASIEALRAAGPEMDALVAELNRAIEHHVKEERDELFPKARASSMDLAAVGEQLRTRQSELTAQARRAAS